MNFQIESVLYTCTIVSSGNHTIIHCICAFKSISTSHRMSQLSHKSFQTLPPTTTVLTVVTDNGETAITCWLQEEWGERYDYNNRWPPYKVCVTRIHTYSGYKLCGQRCTDANYVFFSNSPPLRSPSPVCPLNGLKKTRITWVFKTHEQNNNNDKIY